MKTMIYPAALLLAAFAIAQTAVKPGAVSGGAADFPEGVTQFATIDALLAAVYDGPTTIEEITRHGNIGLGTFNGLDGELVMVDGVVRKVAFDGSVSVVPDTEMTPYATVYHSDPATATTFTFPAGVSYAKLNEGLDKMLGDEPLEENYFYAIRMKGHFKSLKSRSVPKQKPPYVEMTKVVEGQSIFEWENQEFTMVGFWGPPYSSGISVPGWHVHCLTGEKNGGGHVLGFETADDVKVELWKCHDLHLHLPKEGAFGGADLAKDRSEELEKVESDRK